MRTVGIVLDQHVVPALQTPPETGQVRGTEPLLAHPVHDVDVVVGSRELISDVTGAVGRVVVGDENVRAGNRSPQAAGDALDVLQLVVRRDDHENFVEGNGVDHVRCLSVRRGDSILAYRTSAGLAGCAYGGDD